MYTRSLILFSIILHFLLCVYGETRKKPNLPFVAIRHKGELELPNQIDKANINAVLGFTGDVQFSKDNSKDQMFFCPLHTVTQLDQVEIANDLLNHSFWLREEYGRKEISNNCLFQEKFEKKDILQCANDAIPTIHQSAYGEKGHKKMKYCGGSDNNNPYPIYKFVYEICSPRKNFKQWKKNISLRPDFNKFNKKARFHYEQYMVYEICYNHVQKNTIYTKHTLKSVNLLFDERLEHEKEKEHSMMTDGYESSESDFRYMRNLYYQDRILKSTGIELDLLGDTKIRYILSFTNKYVAEKLVPPNDMITSLLKKPTFHYINVQPMHADLQNLWHYIEELIRENFNTPTENEVEIYTGAFPLLNPDPITLKDWPSGVPHVWIKVIHKKENFPNGQTLVIIMKNENKYEEEEFKFNPGLNELCAEDHCQSFKQDKKVLKEFGDLVKKIRCCQFSKEINSAFFNIDLSGEDELLQINDLTDRPKYVIA